MQPMQVQARAWHMSIKTIKFPFSKRSCTKQL